MIILSLISVALSSIVGIHIRGNFLPNNDAYGGQWPATCGDLSPAGICHGVGENNTNFKDDAHFYLILMIIIDIIAICLVVWKMLTEVTDSWASMAKVIETKTITWRLLTAPRATICIRIFLHSLVAFSLFACFGIEFYYVYHAFTSAFIETKSWGFGQIVGITVWARVFLELAYLEYSQSHLFLIILARRTTLIPCKMVWRKDLSGGFRNGCGQYSQWTDIYPFWPRSNPIQL